MQGQLGVSLIGLGEPQKAVRVLERASEEVQKELGEDHPHTLTSMERLAVGYQEAGQLEKSEVESLALLVNVENGPGESASNVTSGRLTASPATGCNTSQRSLPHIQ